MDYLTESARQNLVSQGIIIGTVSILTSLGLLLTGVIVLIRSSDILRFTSLTYLSVLELVCGMTSLLVLAYVWWIVAGYRSRQFEIRAKYLDENMTRGLIALIFPILLTFSAFVVSAVYMLLKTQSSCNYDLKTAMSLYSTDVTRKLIIDKLQVTLECCGSQSLLDWFLVDWQNADVDPGEHLPNKTTTDWDSVPFSCCCPESPPPCIHHQLKIFGVGSIYTAGCADKLDEAIFIFVVISAILFFVLTLLMMFLVYTGRKLQTSARSAIEKGDATASGAWWILYPSAYPSDSQSSDETPLLCNSYACTPLHESHRDEGCRKCEENSCPRCHQTGCKKCDHGVCKKCCEQGGCRVCEESSCHKCHQTGCKKCEHGVCKKCCEHGGCKKCEETSCTQCHQSGCKKCDHGVCKKCCDHGGCKKCEESSCKKCHQTGCKKCEHDLCNKCGCKKCEENTCKKCHQTGCKKCKHGLCKKCSEKSGCKKCHGCKRKHNEVIISPCVANYNAKFIDSSLNERWTNSAKKAEDDSSEEWTRMAFDASGTTSTTSFITSSGNTNSTPESRRSISDTVVANLEVSHPFEHKIRPLYRT